MFILVNGNMLIYLVKDNGFVCDVSVWLVCLDWIVFDG